MSLEYWRYWDSLWLFLLFCGEKGLSFGVGLLFSYTGVLFFLLKKQRICFLCVTEEHCVKSAVKHGRCGMMRAGCILLFWKQTYPSSLSAVCWLSWRSKVSFHPFSPFLPFYILEVFQNVPCSLPEGFVLSLLPGGLSSAVTQGSWVLPVTSAPHPTAFWARADKKA